MTQEQALHRTGRDSGGRPFVSTNATSPVRDLLVNLLKRPSDRYRAAMASSLRAAVEEISEVGRDEPGWEAAVIRAARLIEAQRMTKEGEWRRHLAMQSLALILFALDRDEQLDDTATLTALAAYVHTPRCEHYALTF